MATHPATRSNHNPAFGRPSSIAPVAPRPAVREPQHWLGKLWRRRKSIFGIAAILMLFTVLILGQLTPRYRAETLLMIESRVNNSGNPGSQIAGLPLDNEAIASEIEIIRSRSLAEKVIDQLQLSDHPEFNISLDPPGRLEKLGQLRLFAPGSWLEPLGRYLGKPQENIAGGRQRARIVDTFLQGLTVTRKGNSRGIELSYTAQDPKTATAIVNTLAELYLRDQLETRRETTRTANQRLAERLKQLRRQAFESEMAVERHRQTIPEPVLTRSLQEQQAKLQALEDEAEADRKVLRAFLVRAKETFVQDKIEDFQADARIISHGDVPLKPSYPKPVPILMLMLVASTLTGVLLVFVDELLDRGFRNCEDAETLAGVRLFAYLPNTRRRWMGKKTASSAKTAFAEAVRTLYTSLLLAASGQAPKTVLVTSTESAEGKSTIAACLGLTRALAGNKTLIVDLNLRKPHLHKMFGIKRSPGLVELLSGDAALETVVHTNSASGVDILTAGSVCMNPADIMMGDNLETLMEILRAKYDLVILDSAPFMTYPDTRVLLDKADAVILVTRWAQTKRRLVRKTLRQIMDSGEQLTGVALNRVDVKAYAKNGYKTAGYCAGR